MSNITNKRSLFLVAVLVTAGSVAFFYRSRKSHSSENERAESIQNRVTDVSDGGGDEEDVVDMEDDPQFEVVIPCDDGGDGSANVFIPPDQPPLTKFWTALDVYNDYNGRWRYMSISISNALKFCYDKTKPLNAPAGQKLKILNEGLHSNLWDAAHENSSYRTGGDLVNRDKNFLIALSRTILPHPVILIAFPGMDLALADCKTVTSFLKGTLSEIKAHTGFLNASNSCWILLTRGIRQLLEEARLSLDDVQLVFCGHSLGGAVATLSAYRLVREWFGGSNVHNQCILFTLGQPKSVSAASVNVFDSALIDVNYIRFVTYGTYKSDRVSTASDPITGFRRQVDSQDADTVGLKHAGLQRLLDSGMWLQSEPFLSSGTAKKVLLLAAVPSEIASIGGAIAAQFVGKERFALHNQRVYYNAIANDITERQRKSTNTHHSGMYCRSKFLFAQQMWWECCGKPDVTAPPCQPGTPRKHRKGWRSIAGKWGCCNRDRSAPGCGELMQIDASKHHPARYSSKHSIWHCCNQRSKSAPGCQFGQPMHHSKSWHTIRKFWGCCGNKQQNCKGCQPGI